MIKVIKENPVPKGIVTCSNCGSELEYGNTDLQEDYNIHDCYTAITAFTHYRIHCPVCGCDTNAPWINK